MKIGEDIDKNLNMPVLLEGRFPEKENEILVERLGMLQELDLEVGDTVTLTSGRDTDIRNYLKTDRFKVVGIVQSPYYISFAQRGAGSIGNGTTDCYAIIPEETFVSDIYTEAFVTVKGARELDTFTKPYGNLVDEIVDQIEEVGKKRETERKSELTNKAYKNIDKNLKELNIKEKEFRETFITGEGELYSGKDGLKSNKRELDNNINNLNSSLRILESSENEINLGLKEINRTRRELEESLVEIDEGLIKIEDGKTEIEEGIININENIYNIQRLYEFNSPEFLGYMEELEKNLNSLENQKESMENEKIELNISKMT